MEEEWIEMSNIITHQVNIRTDTGTQKERETKGVDIRGYPQVDGQKTAVQKQKKEPAGMDITVGYAVESVVLLVLSIDGLSVDSDVGAIDQRAVGRRCCRSTGCHSVGAVN